MCKVVGDNWGYDTWGSTESDLEVREAGGCVDGIHDVESNSGEGTDPAFLVAVNMLMNALVNSFV